VAKNGQRDSSRITGCSDDVPGMSVSGSQALVPESLVNHHFQTF
jgi:hypothetical protein